MTSGLSQPDLPLPLDSSPPTVSTAASPPEAPPAPEAPAEPAPSKGRRRGLWLGLAVVGIQGVHTRFGPTVATFINSLRSGQLSRLDTALLERGYYEDLARVDRFGR